MADISKITLKGVEYDIKDAESRKDVANLPEWAKAPNKPTYTAAEVGADAKGAASESVSEHNTGIDAHSDIRKLISDLADRLNVLADSDDETLDQLSEIVAYIKTNRGLIDAITTGKVSVSDIVDNLSTNAANRPLSAAQGVALKALIDAVSIPTKVSQLENDAEYITEDAIPAIPAALPNPQKLTFTGAVEAEYDGSEAVSVEIPTGGSGGGASSPWNVVTELTLDEEMAVTLPVPEEAAGYTQWRAQLAIPKVETTQQFISSTLFFGMSAATGVPALHASYGIGVVVQADWITGDERGTYQATFAEFSSATPEFASTPRSTWTIKRAGATDVTDRSVLFKSSISLPAGTMLLFLGR